MAEYQNGGNGYIGTIYGTHTHTDDDDNDDDDNENNDDTLIFYSIDRQPWTDFRAVGPIGLSLIKKYISLRLTVLCLFPSTSLVAADVSVHVT